MYSVTKDCSDLSLFEQIVLVITQILQISRPSDSKFKSFSRSVEQFFLTVGQNNFGNKIPNFQATVFSRDIRCSNINKIEEM